MCTAPALFLAGTLLAFANPIPTDQNLFGIFFGTILASAIFMPCENPLLESTTPTSFPYPYENPPFLNFSKN